MTQAMPQSPGPRQGNGCLRGLYILILASFGGCAGLVGFGTILDSSEKKLYDQGLTAYQSGDCQTAVQVFNQLLDGKSSDNQSDRVARARAKKAECDAFLVGANQQKAGQSGPAMVGYTNFAANYKTSPLLKQVQQSTSGLFQQGDLKVLAQPEVCQQLKVVVERKLMPAPDRNAPAFYRTCGQNYEAKKQYSEAVGIYEQFLQQYPKHALASEVKAALARSLVAEAKAMGSGNIPEPGVSGASSYGTTTVVIQNESPEKLQIVFSGPEPRFETVAPCPSCTKFKNEGPGSCPNKGPVGTFTLKPGSYDVVVKSNSGNVRPFTGRWNLGEGSEYNSCFYIITRGS